MTEINEVPAAAAADAQATETVEAAKEEVAPPATNGNVEAEEKVAEKKVVESEEAVAEEKVVAEEMAVAEEASSEPAVKKAKKTPKKKVASSENRRSSSRLSNASTGTKLSEEITSDNLPKGAC